MKIQEKIIIILFADNAKNNEIIQTEHSPKTLTFFIVF